MHEHDLLDAQFLNDVFYQNHRQSPSGIDNLKMILAILFMPFVLFFLNTFKLFVFPVL